MRPGFHSLHRGLVSIVSFSLVLLMVALPSPAIGEELVPSAADQGDGFAEPSTSPDAKRAFPDDETAIAAVPGHGNGTQPFVSGEVIVRFQPGSTGLQRAAVRAAVQAAVVRDLRLSRTQLLSLPPGLDVEKAIEQLEKRPGVSYAEPNYIYQLFAAPDDTFFDELWGLHNTGQEVNGTFGTDDADIDALEAWDITQGSMDVLVGVIDSGIDYDHPDLQPNLWINPGESGPGEMDNGIDDDGNGYIDDWRGWDFGNDDNDPLDLVTHGSHVAGTIGAQGNNAIGISGVSQQVSLVMAQCGDAAGCATADTVDAYLYVASLGARVANASLGSPSYSQAAYDAIAASPDTLYVVAAGNDGENNDITPHYPCAYNLDNILCVAATDSDDAMASFSNYGATSVDLAAPGVDILSTVPEWSQTAVFADDFESGGAAWITGGVNNSWAIVECTPTGLHCWTDSPPLGAPYLNGTDSWLRTVSSVDVATGVAACGVVTEFYIDTEAGFDGLLLEVSPDASTWTTIDGWSGLSPGGQFELDFSPIAASMGSDLYLRYRFVSDPSIVADGVYILQTLVSCLDTTSHTSTYVFQDGTSMASPHVAGAAALLLAADPTLTTAELKGLLMDSVDLIPGLSGTSVTGGRLNVHQALLALNDPPVAEDDSYTTDEDTVLNVAAPGVLDNDTDPDNDPLTAGLETGPANGTLTLNPDGSFTYTPDPDYHGTDTFTYTANDTEPSNIATVTITVTPVNDPPVAVDDSYTTEEDTALNVAAPGVLDNDTDVEGDGLTVASNTDPTNGAVTVNPDGSFTYTPDPDYLGPDSFDYTVTDGVDSDIGTVSLTVTPVNDPPVAVDDSYSTAEDTVLNVAAPGVLDNDTDPENDPLTAGLETGPANGTLTLNPDGSFTYTPDPDYHGTDTFTYTANDTEPSNIATVTITVTPVNDPPVPSLDAATTAEDTPVNIAVLTGATDVENDTISLDSITQPANGLAVINADGETVDYTPDADFNGADTFTYTITDGLDPAAPKTVTVTVTPVNDPPVAVADSYSTAEDTLLTVAAPGVLDNDTDPENDPLTVSASDATSAEGGTVTMAADGSFTYDPPADYAGPDSFDYTAFDGGDTDVGTVTITVTPVNDPPVAVDDSYSTAEDTLLTVAAPGVLDNDTDPENDPLTVSAADNTSAQGGTVAVNPDGSFTYDPPADYAGPDSFDYTAFDGGDTDVGTVTITVAPVNDPPTAEDDSYDAAENTPLVIPAPGVLDNDTDVDQDTLTVSDHDAGTTQGGTVAVNPDGSFTYTPPVDFIGLDSFTYAVFDGNLTDTATVTIDVQDVPHPPVAGDDAYDATEDTQLVVGAPGVLTNDSDADGDELTVSAFDAASAQGGTVAMLADGSFTYDPPVDFAGVDSFTYTVSDGVDTDTATVTITVAPTPDAPEAVDDSYSVTENNQLVVAAPGVLNNDTDVDGDTLTVSAFDAVSVEGGTVLMADDGSFTYTPPVDFTGTDTFTYEASDGALIDSATVTITVSAPGGGDDGGGVVVGGIVVVNSCPDSIPDAGFTDVLGFDDETGTAIDCLVFYGISKGTGTDSFSPLLPVTRRQMALFLTRQLTVHGVTLPEALHFGFDDIGGLPAETREAIDQLAALGITQGTTATTFDPDAAVTRRQMALFIARMAEVVGITLEESPPAAFLDLTGLPVSTQLAINQLAAAGITTGTTPSTYDPDADVLRWQMALFLTRTLQVGGIEPQ